MNADELRLKLRLAAQPAPVLRAAGLKHTTYIRRFVLAAEEAPPLDRTRLARTVDALARDLDDLRRMAG
ncbi:MAG: hypothetical protein ACFCVF_17575 [Kineosporiaceae bacterium]